MANPQRKNGHTQVTNEILDALAKQKISGQEWQIIIAILRKTYGFNKTEDWISLSQFEKATGLNVQRVSEALKGLEAKRIITKKRKGNLMTIGFQKDYEKWTPLRKTVTLTGKRKGYVKTESTLTLKRKQPLRFNVTTKETITKETITKEKDTKVSSTKVDRRKPKITNFLEVLKELLHERIKLGAFVDSKIERNMARHCLGLIQKIGSEEFRRRLESLLDDPFKAQHCNKIKFIYNNIKGFIEPKTKKSNIII